MSVPDMAVLGSERLALEPLHERHRDDFARLATDARVVRFIGDGRIWDRARCDEVFTRQLDHWTEHGFGWRSAIRLADRSWIGFVGLNYTSADAIEIPDPEVEIGWWLDPGVWRKGYATEGATVLRDEAFGRVGLDRIIGRFQPDNVASGRVMERIGMRFEREAAGRHGESVRIYALHRDEWLPDVAIRHQTTTRQRGAPG